MGSAAAMALLLGVPFLARRTSPTFHGVPHHAFLQRWKLQNQCKKEAEEELKKKAAEAQSVGLADEVDAELAPPAESSVLAAHQGSLFAVTALAVPAPKHEELPAQMDSAPGLELGSGKGGKELPAAWTHCDALTAWMWINRLHEVRCRVFSFFWT